MAVLGEIARIYKKNPDGTRTDMGFQWGGAIVPILDSSPASQQPSLNEKASVKGETDPIDPKHPSGKAQLVFHHALDLLKMVWRGGEVNVFVEDDGTVHYRKGREEPITPTGEPIPMYQIVPKYPPTSSKQKERTVFAVTPESIATEPKPKKPGKRPRIPGFTGYWRGIPYKKGQPKQ